MKTAASTKAKNAYKAAITKACRLIEEAGTQPRLDALAKESGMSSSHFHRIFKDFTGLTPKAYALAYRSEKLRAEILRTNNVTTTIYASGFSSSGRFYESSGKILGMKPSQARAKAKGLQIRFAVGQCSLGSILVAATEKGICAVTLADTPDPLIEDLQHRFSGAELIGADRDFEKHVAKVVGLVEHPEMGFDLPLDVRGTAFQERVWQALRKIPYGTTATYMDIAKDIGMPKAVRAVAQACGANNIAVVIPCHRVVRTDGSLSGYRWGVKRKAELLRREKKK